MTPYFPSMLQRYIEDNNINRKNKKIKEYIYILIKTETTRGDTTPH